MGIEKSQANESEEKVSGCTAKEKKVIKLISGQLGFNFFKCNEYDGSTLRVHFISFSATIDTIVSVAEQPSCPFKFIKKIVFIWRMRENTNS